MVARWFNEYTNTMKASLIITVIFLVIVLALGGAYFLVPSVKTVADDSLSSLNLGSLFSGSEPAPTNTTPSTGPGISTEQFEATLGRLQTVEKQLGDQSVLNDSRLTSLIDFSVEPKPEPVGNKAPFVAPPKTSPGRP